MQLHPGGVLSRQVERPAGFCALVVPWFDWCMHTRCCLLLQGAGVLDREQSRMNQMRHTAQKLQQVLHMDRSNYNTEWLVTNR